MDYNTFVQEFWLIYLSVFSVGHKQTEKRSQNTIARIVCGRYQTKRPLISSFTAKCTHHSFAADLTRVFSINAPLLYIFLVQQEITMFNPEDFAFSLGGPEPSAPVDGFQLRAVNLDNLPALAGQGISMVLFNLDACTINLPHVHPRATEVTGQRVVQHVAVHVSIGTTSSKAARRTYMSGDVGGRT